MIPVFAYKWIAVGVAILGLSIAVWVQTSRLDTTKKEYSAFVATVKAQSEIAQAKARQIEAENKERKEKADHENAKSIAALNVTIKRLRDENPGVGRLPQAPATSARPDLACFDRAEYKRAYGDFIAEIRALADEGSACTVNLNTAKQWALSVK